MLAKFIASNVVRRSAITRTILHKAALPPHRFSFRIIKCWRSQHHPSFQRTCSTIASTNTTSTNTTDIKDDDDQEEIAKNVNEFLIKAKACLDNSSNTDDVLSLVADTVTNCSELSTRSVIIEKVHAQAMFLIISHSHHKSATDAALNLVSSLHTSLGEHEHPKLRESYSAIFSVLVRTGDAWDVIINTYRDVVTKALVFPTSQMNVALLTAYNRVGKYDAVTDTLDGFANNVFLTPNMTGTGQEEEELDLTSLFQNASQIPLTVHCYREGMNAASKVGNVGKVKEYIRECELNGWNVEFDELKYAVLAAVNANEIQEALSAHEAVVGTSVMKKSYRFTFSRLLHGVAKTGDYEKVLELYTECVENNILEVNPNIWSTMVRTYAKLGRFSDAIEMYVRETTSGTIIDHDSNTLFLMQNIALEVSNLPALLQVLKLIKSKNPDVEPPLMEAKVRAIVNLFLTNQNEDQKNDYLHELWWIANNFGVVRKPAGAVYDIITAVATELGRDDVISAAVQEKKATTSTRAARATPVDSSFIETLIRKRQSSKVLTFVLENLNSDEGLLSSSAAEIPKKLVPKVINLLIESGRKPQSDLKLVSKALNGVLNSSSVSAEVLSKALVSCCNARNAAAATVLLDYAIKTEAAAALSATCQFSIYALFYKTNTTDSLLKVYDLMNDNLDELSVKVHQVAFFAMLESDREGDALRLYEDVLGGFSVDEINAVVGKSFYNRAAELLRNAGREDEANVAASRTDLTPTRK